MIVLGIETSCDESAVALYDSERGLLGHRLYSQIALHAQYGGVVPELASRDHVRKILPLINDLMDESGLELAQLDGLCYTAGPGLVGALLVGAAIGRSLAWALSLPAVPVHHMEGHLLAPMLEAEKPAFPFVALLVSGGHTQLVQVEGVGRYTLLGDTLDDAVGEAFDKTAKLLGLPYPGGPALAELAQRGQPDRYRFPRPMTDRPGLDFSFSGIKTFAITTWRDSPQDDPARADIAHAFQQAVVETLVIKCRRALEQSGLNELVVAGGVGANRLLRKSLEELMQSRGGRVYYPRPEFCTDNGAMIAHVGCLRLLGGEHDEAVIRARPRWPLVELSEPG